jgi:hypothetical protein
MKHPLTSIIIPCFNAGRYVGEAIGSAVGQVYSPVEVIVVDDGSTDGSLEVIRGFGDAVRWESGPNRGGCAARNRGLELARGEWIQFLDADDLLDPDKLQLQVKEAAEDDNTLVFCDGETLDPQNGESVRDYRRHIGPGDDAVLFMLSGGLPTPAPLHWKKHLVAVGGFREELPCSQERDLHLRLACRGLTFRHLPQTLYTVRRVSGSVSSDSLRVLDQHSGIAWHAYEMLEASGGLSDERRAALAGFLASDARAYLQHGLADKARDYFEQAARLHPDGGIPQAYSGRTRWLYHTLGPAMTQRLVGWKRTLHAQV